MRWQAGTSNLRLIDWSLRVEKPAERPSENWICARQNFIKEVEPELSAREAAARTETDWRAAIEGEI